MGKHTSREDSSAIIVVVSIASDRCLVSLIRENAVNKGYLQKVQEEKHILHILVEETKQEGIHNIDRRCR
jgi:hypothetical protein